MDDLRVGSGSSRKSIPSSKRRKEAEHKGLVHLVTITEPHYFNSNWPWANAAECCQLPIRQCLAGDGRNRTCQIPVGPGMNLGENTAPHSGEFKPTCCQLGNEFFAFSKCKILILDSNRGRSKRPCQSIGISGAVLPVRDCRQDRPW